MSLAVESNQVIAGHIAGGASVYSISNWLDEQLRNPLATPKRSFHRYITQLYYVIVSREKGQNESEKRHKTTVHFHMDILMHWQIAGLPLSSNKGRFQIILADWSVVNQDFQLSRRLRSGAP